MFIQVNNSIELHLIDYPHAEQLFNLAKSNRLHLREWLPWVDNMRSIEDFRKLIYNSKQRFMSRAEISFVIMVDHVMAGRIGLYNIDHQNKIASIGYWLDQLHQGQGIVTKSCRALIKYGFAELGLNRIEIRCGTANQKSQAVPERLHFKKEGLIRQAEFVNNQFIDLYIYALLREEYNADAPHLQ